MSLKRSPSRASFSFGKRKSLPMPNLASRGDAGSHRLIWKQETGSQCGTNLEQIFVFCKSLFKIYLAASLPIPRRSASSLVVIRLSLITMARTFTAFSLDRAETARPGRGSSSSDSLLLEIARTVGRIVHDCHHRIHFPGLGTLPWQFSLFKVKFNHGTLLHVEIFDTRNKHACFDGNKTTITGTTEISLCSLKRAHTSGQNHVIFC
jgi:hypothetical protein